MPRIRPYESQVSSQGDLPSRGAQPGDFAGAGLTNLGQGVQNLATDAGQVQRFLNEAKAQREVTDAQTKLLQLSNDLTLDADRRHREWKPGDPYLSEVVPGRIKQDLDNLGYNPETGTEVFETQAGTAAFTKAAERLRMQTAQTLMHVDADLAGKAAVIQHKQLVDSTGNFLYSHPAYFPLRQEEVEKTILDPHGAYARVPAVEREKLARSASEQLALASAHGFIRKNPNLALEILQDPSLAQDEKYGWMPKYIDEAKRDDLVREAQTAVNAQETAMRQAEAERLRQQKELYHATDTKLMEKYALHRANPNAPNLSAWDVYDAMQQGTLDGRTGAALINMLDGDASHAGKAKTDPAVEHALFNQIHRPYGDPQKLTSTLPIIEAHGSGKLSWEDYARLRKEFDESRTEEGSKLGESKASFLEGQRHKIDKSNPMLGKLDQTGAEQFSSFKYFVNEQVELARKNNEDPKELFNPDSPKYLGKHTERFEIPFQESIRNFSQKLKKAPGVPKAPDGGVPADKQRKEGETPAQYLERMKK
jgi:hypothetical protein